MSVRIIKTVSEVGARVGEHYGHGMAVEFAARERHPEPFEVANFRATPVPAGAICAAEFTGTHLMIMAFDPPRSVV
jgi:hypothetical protein